eukprot:50385-Pyramimonas_sp.AAC.2
MPAAGGVSRIITFTKSAAAPAPAVLAAPKLSSGKKVVLAGAGKKRSRQGRLSQDEDHTLAA